MMEELSEGDNVLTHEAEERNKAARREMLLANLAKARAARQAKLALARENPQPNGANKKQKKAKKPARKKTAPAVDALSWLYGLGHAPNGCPVGCNTDRCVITGENVCGHPETSLQSKYLAAGFAEVLERFNAARVELHRLDAERAKK